MATAVIDAAETMRVTDEHRLEPHRSGPSWMAMAAIVLSVMIPLAGWMVALSNRVAVLETDNSRLSTAAVEIAALKQELTDFRREYEQDTVNRIVLAGRQAK